MTFRVKKNSKYSTKRVTFRKKQQKIISPSAGKNNNYLTNQLGQQQLFNQLTEAATDI